MKRLALTLGILSLPACSALSGPREVISSPTRDWRTAATSADRERLRDWRAAFIDGLNEARASGHGSEISKEGVLLDPDSALGGGPIPNGQYRCRVIKLGSKTGGTLAFVAYSAFSCRIRQEREIQGFAKLTGSQRPIGLIFPGDALRQVFLGTLVLGDESRAMQYGFDPDRDVAAFVERIGERRWRMVLPRPAFESDLDVIELVPAS